MAWRECSTVTARLAMARTNKRRFAGTRTADQERVALLQQQLLCFLLPGGQFELLKLGVGIGTDG